MSELFDKIIVKLMNPWVIVGFIGQVMFFGRFIVQWIASERQKQSVIPVAFWYLSLGGGIFLLAYSISVGDIVFMSGSGLNLIIYARNLVLIKKSKYGTN